MADEKYTPIRKYTFHAGECGGEATGGKKMAYGDTISRKDAIDALAEQMPQPYTPDGSHPADKGIFMAQEIYADCIQTLEDLPPAQPEPCEDAVSKETILKFLDDWMSALDENCHNQSVSDLKIIKRDFENLPPVTHKQRTGKWLWQTGKIRCNQCLRAIRRIDHDGLLNFCPNCGAEMAEGDSE